MLTNIGSPQAAPETGEVYAAAASSARNRATRIRRAEDIAAAFEGSRPKRRTLRPGRSNLYRQSQSNHHACARRAAAYNFNAAPMSKAGSHVLWTRLFGSIPTLCRVGRQDSARAKPSDIPVEQRPNRAGINLKTAKALGLTVPQSVLISAAKYRIEAIAALHESESGDTVEKGKMN